MTGFAVITYRPTSPQDSTGSVTAFLLHTIVQLLNKFFRPVGLITTRKKMTPSNNLYLHALETALDDVIPGKLLFPTAYFPRSGRRSSDWARLH